MGIISWNKIARIFVNACPWEMHVSGWWGGAGPSPALPKVWGTGATRLWDWVWCVHVLGKGRFSCIFHLTNHRPFVFKHFGYSIAVGMGCITTDPSLLHPHPTPWCAVGPWPGTILCQARCGAELRNADAESATCSSWNPEAFNLERMMVFSLNFWLPPWGVCLAPSVAATPGDTNPFPPQLLQEGPQGVDPEH